MKKWFILIALLIVGLFFVPAVSAEKVIWDYTAYEFTDTSGYVEKSSTSGPDWGTYDKIYMTDISLYQTLAYVSVIFPFTDVGYSDNGELIPAGRHEFTYSLKDQYEKLLIVYIDRYPTSTKITMFFEDWDIEGLSGMQLVNIYGMYFSKKWGIEYVIGSPNLAEYAMMITWRDGREYYIPQTPLRIDWGSGIEWQNHIYLEELDPNPLGGYEFSLFRNIDGKYYYSDCKVYMDEEVIFSDSSTTDIKDRWFSLGSITQINVTSPTGRVYKFPVTADPGDPGGPVGIPINIRVQNSQTGALLANAHITITANVNGEFHEVVNETLPAGTKTYNLQPTGGGLPNPDFYRLIATVEGYNPIMPYIDFEADISTTIYAYLNPVGGAPINENKTFIDFYVRDLNAKPVSGATVKFGPYTLLTNSAGYAIFEVDKDKLYVWTVSKVGYDSVTGNALIGSDARYTINAVIGPAVTPTLPTPTPTTTPGKPSPTLTGPTGEPVSNLLEWAAAHFGMLLGGGLEIGKIFMWLCFTIPAGVYVGNKAKAGAAGFMAGAGIVTLFFVIIGWVPIWLVVIIALIIGLLYAKVFSNIGNGGGR